jgi:iron(III) transport system substrate-binding protein
MVKTGSSLFLLLAATGLAQSPGDWQKVFEAAKREGKVVLYSALVGAPSTERITEAFEAKYGIPVETLEARASELVERVRTEQASGRSLGDVSYNGSTATERQMADSVFVPHGGLPRAAGLAGSFTSDGTRVPAFVIHFGILVNTELVNPQDEPRSWKDLLAPRWKGQILADDVHPVGSGSLFFQATYGKLGREFHEKLAAQDPSFTRDPRGSQRRVARGEYPIFLPSSLAAMKELEGLPVKTVVPSEGAVYVLYQAAMFKNAPHPNAARLFMDFLLSDEAQAIYVEDGYGPVVESARKKASPPPLLGTSELATMAEMARLAKEIYK